MNLAFVHLKEFSQDIDKCISELDKIVYSLKNMESIQKTNNNPFSNEKGDFYDTIAEMSRYSSLTAEEQMEYHAWRIHENDQQLREIRSHNEGRNIGRAEGRAEGKAEGLAEGRIEGKAEGRAEGRAEGKLDQALNTARKLYYKGMNLEEIAELTDLSIEQLKASLQTK